MKNTKIICTDCLIKRYLRINSEMFIPYGIVMRVWFASGSSPIHKRYGAPDTEECSYCDKSNYLKYYEQPLVNVLMSRDLYTNLW